MPGPASNAKGKVLKNQSKAQNKTKDMDMEVTCTDSESQDDESLSESSEQSSNQSPDDGEFDADAPRVAVWEEDNGDFLVQQDDEENELSDENKLQNDLQHLPFGALRRAQHLLKQATAESDSDSDDSLEPETETRDLKGKGKEKVEWSTKPVQVGRRNKHAPVETTSKKPVSRNRIASDAHKIIPRDPRFLPMTGRFDPNKFQQSYGFLDESRKTELQVLRESLRKARKLLASSPHELRGEREKEIDRLERAMKRTESAINRDRIARTEQEALRKMKKEETEKQKQGKGKWYLKKAEEKKILLKAKYEMLSKEGGQRAVKKAIEKRQKKVGQREKRTRPYVAEAERPTKRLRVE